MKKISYIVSIVATCLIIGGIIMFFNSNKTEKSTYSENNKEILDQENPFYTNLKEEEKDILKKVIEKENLTITKKDTLTIILNQNNQYEIYIKKDQQPNLTIYVYDINTETISKKEEINIPSEVSENE